MPTRATRQFDAWSYSRLQDYESCPFFARCKHLDKLPTPAGPAMARGREVHQKCDQFTSGVLAKLPAELQLFKAEFAELRKVKKHIRNEMQLGLTREWLPTDWFGPATWCRIVMDCFRDLSVLWKVIDYKTGRVSPAHKEQLSLYAIGGFAVVPKNVDRIDTELWYLDQGELVSQAFMRSEVPALKRSWERRIKPMLADRTFRPTPGECCRAYGKPCPFSKKEGGQCRF